MSKNDVEQRKEIKEAKDVKVPSSPRKANRVLAIVDFVLRLIAIIGTIASAIIMGTTNETLPFFTRFVHFRAEYNDLPILTFFVIINGGVCGYLVISLALSIFHIVRSNAQKTRILLLIFDMVMMSLLTAGASASAAVIQVAHQGNSSTNWFPICQQYNSFCQRISGALVGSFVAVALFVLIILLLAIAISRC